jgi:peptide/nickel transport system permease protein
MTEQFVRYLGQTARLNLGYSFVTRQPVSSEISGRVWPTVSLVGISTLLSTVLGVMIGIGTAWRRGSKYDYVGTSTTMVFYAMPDFWLGLLLLAFFSAKLGWFPTGGIVDAASDATGLSRLYDQAKHMFLPALTLTLAYLGEYALIMRTSLLDTMGEDYLVLARAKGLRDSLVRRRHAVVNALLPIVTLSAINFGFVLSGAIAVETVFSWPGLGLATSDAARAPDLPMLQGLFLLFSAAVIVANLVADLLYAYLDPRVRTA